MSMRAAYCSSCGKVQPPGQIFCGCWGQATRDEETGSTRNFVTETGCRVQVLPGYGATLLLRLRMAAADDPRSAEVMLTMDEAKQLSEDLDSLREFLDGAWTPTPAVVSKAPKLTGPTWGILITHGHKHSFAKWDYSNAHGEVIFDVNDPNGNWWDGLDVLDFIPVVLTAEEIARIERND